VIGDRPTDRPLIVGSDGPNPVEKPPIHGVASSCRSSHRRQRDLGVGWL